jgi:Helix-turn-helix domain
MDYKPVYSRQEAMDALCIKNTTLHSLINHGKLQTLKIGARTLIRGESIRAIVDGEVQA